MPLPMIGHYCYAITADAYCRCHAITPQRPFFRHLRHALFTLMTLAITLADYCR